MTIDGSKLKYAKKDSDLKGNKGVKSIELKGATISADTDKGGKFWIAIKLGGKNNRQVAAKTSAARDKWIELMKAAAGGEKKAEKPAGDKPAKDDGGKAKPVADKPDAAKGGAAKQINPRKTRKPLNLPRKKTPTMMTMTMIPLMLRKKNCQNRCQERRR